MNSTAEKKDSSSLNLDRIDHIAVAVDDVAKAVDWYLSLIHI